MAPPTPPAILGPSPPPNRPPPDATADQLWKVAGWDTVPLFMNQLSDLNQQSQDPTAQTNASLEALQALIYDEDGDERLRSLESLKERANDLFRSRAYKQALGFYTQAIDMLPLQNQTAQWTVPDELRRSLFSNRAACHLALENYRSCLVDCAAVLQPPLPTPATTLVRKSFFRSAKALAALERFEEALDCLEKLMAIDQRDGVLGDEEPGKLKRDIEARLARRLELKRQRELAQKRQQGLDKAIRDALQLRGVHLSSDTPFPPAPSSLPPGFEPARFDQIPSHLDPSVMATSDEVSIVYPVYVLRPKDECPTRDLVLRWHEDDLVADHLEALCGRTDSHHLYVTSAKRKLLRCGNKLTIRKIAKSLAEPGKGDALVLGDDGSLELSLLPIGGLETEWIAETKKTLASKT